MTQDQATPARPRWAPIKKAIGSNTAASTFSHMFARNCPVQSSTCELSTWQE